MVRVVAETRQRRHRYAVVELGIADLKRLKQFAF
jgi:hypothetical protein